jgi:hypothetical protein
LGQPHITVIVSTLLLNKVFICKVRAKKGAHNVDLSKPLTHMMLYTLSAICPAQLKTAFIREGYISPASRVVIEVEHLPNEVDYDTELRVCLYHHL